MHIQSLQSRNESEQLIRGLREKYAKWDIAYLGQPRPGFAGMMLLPVHEPILNLFLVPTPETIQTDIYKKNPLCKSSKKVNLD